VSGRPEEARVAGAVGLERIGFVFPLVSSWRSYLFSVRALRRRAVRAAMEVRAQGMNTLKGGHQAGELQAMFEAVACWSRFIMFLFLNLRRTRRNRLVRLSGMKGSSVDHSIVEALFNHACRSQAPLMVRKWWLDCKERLIVALN
jgi:hypothetical protein